MSAMSAVCSSNSAVGRYPPVRNTDDPAGPFARFANRTRGRLEQCQVYIIVTCSGNIG